MQSSGERSVLVLMSFSLIEKSGMFYKKGDSPVNILNNSFISCSSGLGVGSFPIIYRKFDSFSSPNSYGGIGRRVGLKTSSNFLGIGSTPIMSNKG